MNVTRRSALRGTLVSLAILVLAPAAVLGAAAFAVTELRSGLRLALWPGFTDGYDGLEAYGGPADPPPDAAGAVFLAPYYVNGPTWSGRMGFYYKDYRGTIEPPATAKTWDNLYLWAQDWSPTGDTHTVYFLPDSYVPPEYGIWLSLDYVPEWLNYSGPRSFQLSATQQTDLVLPLPAVHNPLDGVRMSLTVSVAEPSCFLALTGGVSAVGVAVVRRRR